MDSNFTDLDLLKLFLEERKDWLYRGVEKARPGLETVYVCSKCGESGPLGSSIWKATYLEGTGPHSDCIRQAWSSWVRGALTFMEICRAEKAGNVPNATSSKGIIQSFTESFKALNQQIESSKAALEQKNQVLEYVSGQNTELKLEVHELNKRVRLLLGERLPDTDKDFLELAVQEIHFSGGPNGKG